MPSKPGSSSSRRSSAPSGRSGGGRSGGRGGGRSGGPSRGGKPGGGRGGKPGRDSRGRDSREDRDNRGNSRGARGDRDSRGGRSDNRDSRGNSRGARGDGGGYQGRKDRAPKAPARAETSGWGSVAQHGAAGATVGQRMFEQEAAEQQQFTADERRKYLERQARRDKVTEKQEGLREEARQAIGRGGLPQPKDVGAKVTVDRMPLPGRPPHPVDVSKQMDKIAGKEKGARGWRLFKRAAKEFQNEQFTDARKTMKPLVESYPNVADLHELHGLSLYRLGKWDDAIESLETFRRLSGTAEQNPVLMDCHRALNQWADVEFLWKELGELSPSGELVSEGRIVMAGSQADQGFIDSGIRTLEKGWKVPKEPMEHHLRRAYALADLLERDGKLPKSRKLFAWIAQKDETFGDAAERAQ